MQDNLARSLGPLTLSVVRIVAAVIFFLHGTQAILNFPPTEPQPELFTLMWGAGLLALIGGALLTVGFKSRLVALVLFAQMVATYLGIHASQSLYPVENQGDATILFGLVFLSIAVMGGGPLSIDATLRFFRRPAVTAGTAAQAA